MPIEIYYSSQKERALSESRINYVQLSPNTPYNGYSYMEQVNLYDSNGANSGKFYATNFVQEDSSDDTVNVQGTTTLSLTEGILVYSTNWNKLKLNVGDIAFYSPTYQSGIYYKKNVEVIEELIKGPTDLVYKYTIIY